MIKPSTNSIVPSKQRDRGRFIGAWIYLVGSICVLVWVGYSSLTQLQTACEAVNILKWFWCVGFACVGFSLNAFRASAKGPRSTVSAWPVYLTLYLPTLLLTAFFVYVIVEVYTVDKAPFFYLIAWPLATALGYHCDRIIIDPLSVIPGGSK
jgi:hypothetical protein